MSNTGFSVPQEYHPRVMEFIVTREHTFVMTPIHPIKSRLKHLFTNAFLFFGLISVALSLPLLISKGTLVYSFSLMLGFVLSYFISKIHSAWTSPAPMDRLAKNLGYKSQFSPLFEFDERLARALATENNFWIKKETLYFCDLFAIIFRPNERTKKPKHIMLIK